MSLDAPARDTTLPTVPPYRHRSPWWGNIGGVLRAAGAGILAFVVVGNLAIMGASFLARTSAPTAPAVDVSGVANFSVIDARVWRGAAPSLDGYVSLAAHGVTTVVDLRAEAGIDLDIDLMNRLGITVVRLPVRDGQTPTTEQVDRFLAAVGRSHGVTFVHCGAGVGRAGTMAAAYKVASGQADGMAAVRANLAVGPPSLEQLVFAAHLEQETMSKPGVVVVAASRLLDAPRRIWHALAL